MNLSTYQKLARNTAIYPNQNSFAGINYCILGACGEVGEISGKFKKIIRDKQGIISHDDKSALADEIGDTLWYLAMLAEELGISFDFIATNNISKLKDRQARGKLRGNGDKR